MNLSRITILILSVIFNSNSAIGDISTIAGADPEKGDGKLISNLYHHVPASLSIDSGNNIYLNTRCSIIKVDRITKVLSTIAGDGNCDYPTKSNVGSLSKEISFNLTSNIEIDRANNVLVFGQHENIGKINLETGFFSAMAPFWYMKKIKFDDYGNIFFINDYNLPFKAIKGDYFNDSSTIDLEMYSRGEVRRDSVLYWNSRIDPATDIVVDSIDNIYISEVDGHTIKKIDALTNIVTTIAGVGVKGYSGDFGQASEAHLNDPHDMVIDKFNNMYFIDKGNFRIRKIDLNTGLISTISGTGINEFNGDKLLAKDAGISYSYELKIDNAGDLLFIDGGNRRVRRIDLNSDSIYTELTAYQNIGDDENAEHSIFNSPTGLAKDLLGNLYIADYSHNRIRKLDLSTNTITTIAGTGDTGFKGDGG